MSRWQWFGVAVMAVAVVLMGTTTYSVQQSSDATKRAKAAAVENRAQADCQAAFNKAFADALADRAKYAEQDRTATLADQALSALDITNTVQFISDVFRVTSQKEARDLQAAYQAREAAIAKQHAHLLAKSETLQRHRINTPLPTNHC